MDIDLDEAVSSLRRTPETLRSYFDGLAPRWIDGDEGPGTWNSLETITHMVHVEPLWIDRLEFIAEHGARQTFPLVDRGGHMDAIGSQPIDWLLERFSVLRSDGLQRLAALEMDLTAPGLHGELGPVTMGQLLASWVVHDLNHLGQIVKAMAKQYRDAIGPWRVFLPIVDAQ